MAWLLLALIPAAIIWVVVMYRAGQDEKCYREDDPDGDCKGRACKHADRCFDPPDD